MSKHHNSKTEQEVANGAVPETSSAGAPVHGQTPSVKGDGGEAEIAELAYSYWEARGCTNGSAEDDWVRAEQEMKARRL
jgi:hypothetical protein